MRLIMDRTRLKVRAPPPSRHTCSHHHLLQTGKMVSKYQTLVLTLGLALTLRPAQSSISVQNAAVLHGTAGFACVNAIFDRLSTVSGNIETLTSPPFRTF